MLYMQFKSYGIWVDKFLVVMLRTLVPAHLSFGEDSARILRGLRLAARLNLSFTKEIEDAMHELSSSIVSLSKSRIMMELNYMMSYGAAEPSLSLLQRYNILEIMLPFHVCPYCCIRFWLADEMGCTLGISSGIDYTSPRCVEKHSEDASVYGPEFSDSQGSISDDELATKVAQLAVQVQKSMNILADKDSLLEAMSKFPGAPCSGLVFVSNKMGRAVEFMFDILVKDVTSLKTRRNIYSIDYGSLVEGHMRETRLLLGKVILDTIVPGVTVGVIDQQKENASQANFHEKLELMKPKFVSEDDFEELNENYELQQNFLSEKLDRSYTVNEMKTKGKSAQLPKDEIRMLLEEVKYRHTEKEKEKDEKFQKSAINPLDLLMNNVATKDLKFTKKHDSLRKHTIEEVNEIVKLVRLQLRRANKWLANGRFHLFLGEIEFCLVVN
ncbi:hypothetical protein K7X08_032917 [Anisodus acutangulus]|uniref:tRNA nucleotidyltransferase/poly(A) polymerase RNA and SrmB- binding domain-containing protein n=1 Tax=Anisodus acutangulus TaxID=402998 RepID=A0A9Q1R9M7_9SOLA|nr:hypothetical protein K7X08_032917 [Anisodus acutangulus]